MTLKEEIYQAVHDYVAKRIKQLELEQQSDKTVGGQLELLRVQHLIYKMFHDYNEKLSQHGYEEYIKPVRTNTNYPLIKPK